MNKTKSTTWFSCILSFTIVCLVLAVFLIFSSDAFYKTNPTSTVTEQLNEESKVFLKDFPIMLGIYLGGTNVTEAAKKHISFQGIFLGLNWKENGKLTVAPGIVSKCTKEAHFKAIPQRWNEVYAQFYCVDNDKYVLDGKMVKEDMFVQGDHLKIKGRSLILSMTADSEKAFTEFRDANLVMILSFTSLNLNSYSSPENPKVTSIETKLDFRVFKQISVNVESNLFRSDDGIIFSSVAEKQVLMEGEQKFDFGFRTAELKTIAKFIVANPDAETVFTRIYPKLQTALAQVSAISKILVLVAKILSFHFNKYSLFREYIRRERQIKIRTGEESNFEPNKLGFCNFIRKNTFSSDSTVSKMNELFDVFAISNRFRAETKEESKLNESKDQMIRFGPNRQNPS